MTRIAQPLTLRGAPIIHDTIDNETIVINQLTGAYYSMDGPAAFVWEMLAAGTTIGQLVDALGARFEGTSPDLEREVGGFIDRLMAEELVVAADSATPTDAPIADPGQPRLPFSGFNLQRYTDLEVLLLVDPIHEVDETGWPKPRDAEEE